MNVLHNAYNKGDFFAQISQHGEGPVSYRDAAGKTINLVQYESMGIYVRDEATGHCFSPLRGPLMSVVEDFRYEVRAGYSEYHSRYDGIGFRARLFVPLEERMLVWSIYLTNQGDAPRELSTFVLAKFALPSQVVKPDADLKGVYAWMYDSKDLDRDHRLFMSIQNDFFAASGHREDILEPPLNLSQPRLLKGHNLSSMAAMDFRSMGGLQAKSMIQPGETRRLDIILGHAPTLGVAKQLSGAFTHERVDQEHQRVCEEERRRAHMFSIDTGQPRLDAVINHFAKKQLTAYLVNKSGFRDNVQVCLALDMADQQLSERALLNALSHQYSAGWVPHHFRPLSTKQCSDEPAWILLAIPWHIKQTGDFGFLDKRIPYLDSQNEETVWEHLLKAMNWLLKDTRSNGLCDLRSGDWNDGLSPRGDNGGRTSVMVSQQLCAGLLEISELAERIGERGIAEKALRDHAAIAARINDLAWDGEWYQRVICDDGTILGSRHCVEGKIFMNTQSWAVLGRVASPERAAIAMDSVESHLKLDIGYRVVNPPYSKFDPKVGQSSTVYPGVTENGGCYNHAAGFKVVADCMAGRPEHAWDTLLKVAPGNPENPIHRSKMEPYAFSNLFSADEFNYGRSLYAWRTGTGAWFTMAVLEWILGIRRHYDGLLIDPCLTRRIPEAKVTRRFRGAVYHIKIDNRAGRCRGISELRLNGEPISGNLIPEQSGLTHQVEAVI